ncbi:TetR/AcrR family transcriptional regulator [Prauserella rugosa]|uniref:TetR family transcriptional regulator n=1 Tax=Prauserella rugosa TaxID=43354 RepID=A0A660CC66_9PSEU|nr:TetR/AcrR family transcriptional regulator [Prauserella rugosa]KMS89785.1 TetR family transcriptional regulator [Streptomyces regensis]TWH19119.1 TetR family transcriptional regulator [Prauserella rugosa]
MRRTPEPRAAMIRSAVELIRRQGVAGTSFADVLAHSGAPRGSIYHHFPAGRTQLLDEATRAAGESITGRIARILDAGDTLSALRALVDVWRRDLAESGDLLGCPIAAAALGTDPGARARARATFDDWTTLLAASLRADGLPTDRAHSCAVLILSAVEGALVLARARGEAAPLDDVVDELERAIR